MGRAICLLLLCAAWVAATAVHAAIAPGDLRALALLSFAVAVELEPGR